MLGAAEQAEAEVKEGVVLLHGLARTSRSMDGLERYLAGEGFACLNIGYDSRHHTVEVLAERVREKVAEETQGWDRVHFVTHSMGGIVLRQMERVSPDPRIGRVVMLAPPNQGSEVVDALGDTWCFEALNGPAGKQLGTDKDGFVAGLGPVDFELGVIAGKRRIKSVLDWCFEDENDGKVSVKRTSVVGMDGFLLVPYGHTFLMERRKVREATVRFLRDGRF